MASASVTNTFVASTTANPSAVNQNFTDLLAFLNNSVVHVDGSKAMTAALTLNTESSSNHATRKTYVDAAVLLRPQVGQTAPSTETEAGGTWTPTTQQLILQTGSFTITGDGSASQFSKALAVAFPNGLVTHFGQPASLDAASSTPHVQPIAASSSKTTLRFRVTSAGEAVIPNGNQIQINYVAYGW